MENLEQDLNKIYKEYGDIGVKDYLETLEIDETSIANIIYNLENDFSDLKLFLLANEDKKVSIAVFENIPQNIVSDLQAFKNVNLIRADISNEFVKDIKSSQEIVLFASVGKTNSKLYKQIKMMLSEMNKQIAQEVLI